MTTRKCPMVANRSVVEVNALRDGSSRSDCPDARRVSGGMSQLSELATREYTRASDLESPIVRKDRRCPSSSNPAAFRTD